MSTSQFYTKEQWRRVSTFTHLNNTIDFVLDHCLTYKVLPTDKLARSCFNSARGMAELIPDVNPEWSAYLLNRHVKVKMLKTWNEKYNELRRQLIKFCRELDSSIKWLTGDNLKTICLMLQDIHAEDGNILVPDDLTYIRYAVNGIFNLFQSYYDNKHDEFDKLYTNVRKSIGVVGSFMHDLIPAEYFVYDLLVIASLIRTHDHVTFNGHTNVLENEDLANQITEMVVSKYFGGVEQLDDILFTLKRTISCPDEEEEEFVSFV